MELYIPPPMSFLPRLPPPKPTVPALPIVPTPPLPDVLYAPEGVYTLNTNMFPPTGTAAPPAYDPRPVVQGSVFLGGAGGFMVNQPGNPYGVPLGITAMSFNATSVNGQYHPAYPVKFSWVNIWCPPKGGNERGFGGLIGSKNPGIPGGGGGGGELPPSTMMMTGYEPSVSSDSDSPPASEPPPLDFSFAGVPPQAGGASTSRRIPFTKSVSTTNVIPRPKNNLRSSNSTFVTRLQMIDNLLKIMADKGKNGGELIRWGIWNLGRTIAWAEEGSKIKEPLARVTFSQVPTCHAVSQLTAGPDRIDVIVGFASGDLVWVDFVLGKYTRLNKGGLLNGTAVTSINFDPRQPHYFIVHFADGVILQFNLFADDPPSTISQSPLPWITNFDNERKNSAVEANTTGSGESASEEQLIRWKNEDWALLALEQNQNKKLKENERSPWAGKNPISAFKIGKAKITAMGYSPDGRFLALTGGDGKLRMVDVAEDQLTDIFAGYYGSLNCLAWSPDSRFLAVGGEDDLITIYSPRESRLVARCQGHSAFVTSISFDQTRQESRAYRFASAGEDGKLLLWDFSAAALHRPRHHHLGNSSHHRLAGSTLSLTGGHSRSHLPLGENGDEKATNYHPAPPKGEVAELQPVMARLVEGTMITGVHILSTAIVTISRAASVKFWQRPPKNTASGNGNGNGNGRGNLNSQQRMTGGGGGRERRREREKEREGEAVAVLA